MAGLSGSHPCTITPCEGIIWSGEEVPHDNNSSSCNLSGLLLNNDLTANAVTVAMSGAGSVDLTGAVTAQTVELSGLGACHAGDLASQTAQVTLSGAGEATIWVSEQLDAEISGAGTMDRGERMILSQTSNIGER